MTKKTPTAIKLELIANGTEFNGDEANIIELGSFLYLCVLLGEYC